METSISHHISTYENWKTNMLRSIKYECVWNQHVQLIQLPFFYNPVLCPCKDHKNNGPIFGFHFIHWLRDSNLGLLVVTTCYFCGFGKTNLAVSESSINAMDPCSLTHVFSAQNYWASCSPLDKADPWTIWQLTSLIKVWLHPQLIGMVHGSKFF